MVPAFVRILVSFLLLIPVLAFLAFGVYIITKPQRICDASTENNFPPPPIKKFIWQGTGLITIWFDDAWSSQYSREVIHLMDKHGFVGALSVATGLICNPNYMAWNQVQDLQAKGWEITAHSVNHICDPYAYNAKTTAFELTHSKEVLKLHGLRADNFVIPCGYNPQVLPQAVAFSKKLYSSYRRAGEQINPLPVVNPYNLYSYAVTDMTTIEDVKKWVNEAARKKGWLILVFHQFNNRKLRYNVSVDMFGKILNVIKESKLPVVLPTQALQIRK